MKDQAVEDKFIIQYIHLVENHFLAETISDADNDRLAKIFYRSYPEILAWRDYSSKIPSLNSKVV
jgi:hypothetical protein